MLHSYFSFRFFVGFMLFVAYPSVCFSQPKVDNTQYQATYSFSYKTEPSQTAYAKHDQMVLDIGAFSSCFYSLYQHQRDSILQEGLATSKSTAEIQKKWKGMPNGTTAITYRNLKDRQSCYVENFMSIGFYYDESIVPIDWHIHPTDTQTISGYLCQKATAKVSGRMWSVYFTPDIPLNNGPWKLWGLPGLIISATDSDGYFHYQLTSFIKASQPKPILLRLSSFTNKPYTKVSKQKLLQHQKMFHKNGIAFVEAVKGTKFTTNEGRSIATLIQEKPYIPLELE